LISTTVNIHTISTIVNIEFRRYAAGMTRTRTSDLDPDIRLLSALADPARLASVRQLARGTDTCACDFTETCAVSQPTVSHHLRVLREAGVVTSDRRGQWIYYRLAPDAAERLGAIARGLVPGGLITVSDLLASRRTEPAAAARLPADA
jgi:ArsR family transcriptional regulator